VSYELVDAVVLQVPHDDERLRHFAGHERRNVRLTMADSSSIAKLASSDAVVAVAQPAGRPPAAGQASSELAELIREGAAVVPDPAAFSHEPALLERVLSARLEYAETVRALLLQDVELGRQAVAREQEAVELLRVFRGQASKWTALATWGVGLLLVTVSFGIAMTTWLVLLAGERKISVWALPTAIFVLALFAISPAVLLIRERPLKGLDEWMPGGKAASKGTAAAGR
jgi:hypothetical protein